MFYKIQLWKSKKDDQFYWHLISTRNKKVLATSEGYKSKQGAKKTASHVVLNFIGCEKDIEMIDPK
jgi:uncharacterized protein YegP (UPF0339 family)